MSGTCSTQSGGAGSDSDLSDCAHSTISSRWLTSVPIASENGTANTNRIDKVIRVTATHRRPHKKASTFSINGQAATAIIVAQSIAGRNGRRIQNDAAMS